MTDVNIEEETEVVNKEVKTEPKPIVDTNTYYDCGLCLNKVKILNKETIVCKECGHRILFKQRINKKVEYLAR